MNKRKEPLITGDTYHIFSRSIEGQTIYRNPSDYNRMIELLRYYMQASPPTRYSLSKVSSKIYLPIGKEYQELIQIIAHCIMPNHFHLILKQLLDDGISKYMNNVLNGYSRYFNTKYKRKGRLWESVFENIRIKDDDQLIHLTRYIHLNPTTAFLVNKPDEWKYSSYKEYLSAIPKEKCLCQFDNLLHIEPAQYEEFVLGRIDEQRHLAIIKRLIKFTP